MELHNQTVKLIRYSSLALLSGVLAWMSEFELSTLIIRSDSKTLRRRFSLLSSSSNKCVLFPLMCSLCSLPAFYHRLEDKHGSTRLVPLKALSEYNVYCLLNLISHSYKCNSVVDGVQIVLILSNDVTKVCNAGSNWSACGQPYHQKD